MHINKSLSYPTIYEPIGFIMIRTPLQPVDFLYPLINLPLMSSAFLNKTSSHTLSSAFEQDLQATRTWLVASISDPIVNEAVLVGSPNLFQAIPRWKQNPGNKQGRRAQTKLLRYIIRMATRPTPFGIFAGVALGRIGPTTNIKIGALEQHQKRTRPDMQWFLYLIRDLEQRPDVVENLHFFTNSLCFISNERLYLPHVDLYGQGENNKTVSIRATPIVKLALNLASQGIKLVNLRQQLLVERPNATDEQISGLLKELTQQGALISDLRPPLTGAGDSLHYLLGKLSQLTGCDDIYQQLHAGLALAKTYDGTPIGQGRMEFLTLHETINIPKAKLRSALEVDMSTNLKANTLSESVANEVARAAEILLRISSTTPTFPHLAAYRSEFRERYGERREIPLLELLDENTGLGPPPTYQTPSIDRESPLLTQNGNSLRDRTLLQLAAEALFTKQIEVELNEKQLRNLNIQNSWQETSPDSLELFVSIAAVSQIEIDKGNYRLICSPNNGVVPAGRSFGRFCDILSGDAVDSIRRFSRAEELRQPEKIFAELVYLPMHGHAANVAIRPAVREYEIVVNATPGVKRDNVLPMNDLVIGLRGDRFYVRSLSRNAEVVVRSLHLLSYLKAPNECRFLDEICSEEATYPERFNWGPALQLPFLPRVRVGRIVLSSAEWHLPTELAGRGESPQNKEDWYIDLQGWRLKWNVPRYVYMVEADNRLLFDLENPVCVDDLRNECLEYTSQPDIIILQEVLPGLNEIWTDGQNGKYLVEFIVPLKKRDLPERPMPIFSRLESVKISQRMYLPGSEWLYAKLYSGQTRHEDLLAGPIHEFITRVLKDGLIDSWFFIRYADPEPHIRLRFHGEPARMVSQLLPWLSNWSSSLVERGAVHKLVLDSYDREIERYGGLAGIPIAEHIFAADSMAVADIMALRIRKLLDIPVLDLAILTTDDLLSKLGLIAAERLGLYHRIRQEQEKSFGAHIGKLHKAFYNYRNTAQRIIGDRNWLRSKTGGYKVEECLNLRAIAISPLGSDLYTLDKEGLLWTSKMDFLSSCIHMHCNRLLGVNRTLEFEVMYYLERSLESLEKYVPDGISLV